jgi:hypothetical protein
VAIAFASAGCGATSHQTTSAQGIPKALLAEARPIGRGPEFHPPATGPVIAPCKGNLGPRIGTHVEVFARNRVVIIPAAIGTRPPRTFDAGRIATARCFGALTTTEPTGVVLTSPGRTLTVADLFRSWGQPLSRTQLGPFRAPPGTEVAAFVGGRRSLAAPNDIPLTRHAEIVLEVGPHVPPHSTYTFPPGT